MHRHPLHDDRRPFSAIISFSFMVLLLLQVKPSKYLFRHLLPYPASLRRWKCPSLLERPWTCPTETLRKSLGVDGTFVTRRVRAAMGRPHAQCPHCYFFCYFVIHSLQLDGVLYKPPLVSLGCMTSIGSWASALSFFATISITLMLRCERPRLWSRPKEHLGYFHPVAAVTTCEKRFFSHRS